MKEGFPLDFTTLRKGMILGPEHHQFKLIKPVSNSPIGQVWHADDLSNGEDEKSVMKVALEIVNPALFKDPQTLEIFKSQVTLCKQLDHKHIARIYGYFQSREGWLFVAMEPLSTRSLARILMEDGFQQLSIDKARIILSQVALALDHAHQHNKISHGDLSPWNIIISPAAGVKLVNFAFRQPLLRQIQQQGMRVLNTEYHAPEAFDHIPLPNSADIYSLGCLIFQLLAGHPPFTPETPLEARDLEQLERPQQISPEQWEVLTPALSETPGERPANASSLIKDFFAAQSEQPTQKTKAQSATNTPAEMPISLTGQGTAAPQRGGKGGSQGDGHLARTLLTASLVFTLGLAVGYLLANQRLAPKHQAVLDRITLIQQRLAQPPSAQNKIALNSALAELQTLSSDPKLLSALGSQVENYKVRVEKATAPDSGSPKLVDSREHSQTVTDTAPVAAEDDQFKAGSVFKDEIMPDLYGPNMVVIPPSVFRMGDMNKTGDDNEQPVHPVNIGKPFALSQHEVTFAEYDLFALSTGLPLPNDEGWGRGNRPVINISWNDASAYAHWIRRQTGLSYRLPTEAEWEYAARAGTETRFWWGNEVGTNNAACDDCGSQFDAKSTAPVGSFKANPFGLYDMNGNVYEWVSDCYNETYVQAPNDGSSWQTGQCHLRVMRGGSWYDISRLIRSASRYRHPPNVGRNTWGFRLALDLVN